jgi:hypothetical protein
VEFNVRRGKKSSRDFTAYDWNFYTINVRRVILG